MTSVLESLLVDNNITVSANDPGGSNLLCSIIESIGGSYLFSLTKTSLPIFRRKFPDIKSKDIEECVPASNVLLCTTSWSSTHELEAIKRFKNSGKKTIVVLDHWVNYVERLTFMGRVIIPSHIVVCDKYAFAIASEKFPRSDIILHPNPTFDYFSSLKLNSESFQNHLSTTNRSQDYTNTLLFISQPIKSLSRKLEQATEHPSFDEVECLKYGLKKIKRISDKVKHIIIRLHPLEDKNNYENIFCQFPSYKFELSKGCTLEQDIRRSSLVLGIDSTALVLAALAGRPTFSSIPPGGRQCSLPQPFITRL